jgi:CheR methyltransferase-like protein
MTSARMLEAALPLRRAGRMLRSAMMRTQLTADHMDRAIEFLWTSLPEPARSCKIAQIIGHVIHRRACRVHERGGGTYTRFFRNVPQLELLRDLALEMPREKPLKILVLGCSTGAELYSVLWMLRRVRPEQRVPRIGHRSLSILHPDGRPGDISTRRNGGRGDF